MTSFVPRGYGVAAIIALATVFGAWLRVHGLADQVVQDDEWHAIHKLMTSSYREIFISFGWADHCIPLTLLYKLVAETIGLDEVNMRVLQVTAGIALVPLAGWVMLRATGDRTAASITALFVAVAPFLVLYSRTARPYAISTLLAVAALAMLWRWRETRSLGLGAAIAVACGLTAWFQPLASLPAATGLLFVLGEDLARKDLRRALAIIALGIACAAAIAILLAAPLMHDFASAAGKAGRTTITAYTFWRVLAIFSGGVPDLLTPVTIGLAILGAWRLFQRDRRLGLFAVVVFIVPMIVVALAAADWTHQGHTFGRYVMPAQVIFLGWLALGLTDLVRMLPSRAQTAAAVIVAAEYFAIVPTIHQVTTLGPWYGHLYHHFDYGDVHNIAARQYDDYEIPRFYRELAAMPPGSAPIIEAPFTFGAPANPMAFLALHHAQRSRPGLIHDLCLDGRYFGEPPPDARFRFKTFVRLEDVKATKATGARFLVFHHEYFHGEKPFRQGDRCIAELTRRYGTPISADARVVVYDLTRPSP